MTCRQPARTEVISETIHKFLHLQQVQTRDAAQQRHTVSRVGTSHARDLERRGDAFQRYAMVHEKRNCSRERACRSNLTWRKKYEAKFILEELYIEQLKDLYDAEQQIIEALSENPDGKVWKFE